MIIKVYTIESEDEGLWFPQYLTINKAEASYDMTEYQKQYFPDNPEMVRLVESRLSVPYGNIFTDKAEDEKEWISIPLEDFNRLKEMEFRMRGLEK